MSTLSNLKKVFFFLDLAAGIGLRGHLYAKYLFPNTHEELWP
jgi:hypothetical protein